MTKLEQTIKKAKEVNIDDFKSIETMSLFMELIDYAEKLLEVVEDEQL